MTITSVRLWRLIGQFTKNRESCEIVVPEAAAKLGTSERTLRRALGVLLAEGFVEKRNSGELFALKEVASQYVLQLTDGGVFDKDVRLSDVRVSALQDALGRKGEFFAKRAYIARFTGISEDEVTKARARIKRLLSKNRELPSLDKKHEVHGTESTGTCVPPLESPYKDDRLIEIDEPFSNEKGASAFPALADSPLPSPSLPRTTIDDLFEDSFPDPNPQKENVAIDDPLEDLFCDPKSQKESVAVETRKSGRKPRPFPDKPAQAIENADSWGDAQLLQFIDTLTLAYGVPNWHLELKGAASRSAALRHLRAFCLIVEPQLASRAKLAAFLRAWFANWEKFCRIYPKATKIGFHPMYWKTGAWKNVREFVIPLMKAKEKETKKPVDPMYSIDGF